MKDAPIAEQEVCDEQIAEAIVNGRFSDTGPAIAGANIPTLQRASQLCDEAKARAAATQQPHGQWHDRAILCRARIRRLVAQQKECF